MLGHHQDGELASLVVGGRIDGAREGHMAIGVNETASIGESGLGHGLQQDSFSLSV
jgi:hypothetical protein